VRDQDRHPVEASVAEAAAVPIELQVDYFDVLTNTHERLEKKTFCRLNYEAMELLFKLASELFRLVIETSLLSN
jgi:hypothetical protein